MGIGYQTLIKLNFSKEKGQTNGKPDDQTLALIALYFQKQNAKKVDLSQV